MTRRHRSLIAVVPVALLTGSVIITQPSVVVADSGAVNQQINVPGDPEANVVLVNESATFAVVFDDSFNDFRMALPSGAMTPIDFGGEGLTEYLSTDGRFAYGVLDDETIRRVTVDGGSITDLAIPLDDEEAVLQIVDSDVSGRRLLLDVAIDAGGYDAGYIYDTVDHTLERFEDNDSLVDFSRSFGWSLSDDGNVVVLGASYAPSDFTRAYVRVDLATGASKTAWYPPSYAWDAGEWSVSPDFKWAVFPSSANPFQLSRQDLSGWETVPVPLADDFTYDYAVGDGGGVLFSRFEDTAAATDITQIYLWHGDNPSVLTQITEGVDGQPADLGVDVGVVAPGDFHVNNDASVIVYASTATNLALPATDGEQHVYVSHVPSVTAPLAPSETYCVAPVNASPGDVVGINITPVLATGPGFGVLHSSDIDAGYTSNANFRRGTVDPNVAFVRVGSDGRICYTNSQHGTSHVILDEMIIGDGSSFRDPTYEGATRLIDTREGLGGSRLQPNERRCVIAEGANPGEFVGVNAIGLDATTAGYGTVHSSDTGPGESSTINFAPGSIDPNFAFTKVGSDRQICFTNSEHGAVDLVLDEQIVASPTALRTPSTPTGSARSLDTRTWGSPLAPGMNACFSVPGTTVGDHVESGDFVGVNITPVLASGPGFGTLVAGSAAPFGTSSVNFNVGTVDPNFGMARVVSQGHLQTACFWNSQHSSVHVVIDAQVIADGKLFSSPYIYGPRRLLDTREPHPGVSPK